MDFEQAIRILKEAQGDPARLGLASVDLLLAGQPDEERGKLRTALEVSAVPNWFDEKSWLPCSIRRWPPMPKHSPPGCAVCLWWNHSPPAGLVRQTCTKPLA
jgi:hypothetical protein